MKSELIEVVITAEEATHNGEKFKKGDTVKVNRDQLKLMSEWGVIEVKGAK